MNNKILENISTDALKQELLLREVTESRKVDVEHCKNSTIHFELLDYSLYINIGSLNYKVDKTTAEKLYILLGLLE